MNCLEMFHFAFNLKKWNTHVTGKGCMLVFIGKYFRAADCMDINHNIIVFVNKVMI